MRAPVFHPLVSSALLAALLLPGLAACGGDADATEGSGTAARAEDWLARHAGLDVGMAATPFEAAQGQDVVLTCVGNDDDLAEVVLGEDGALAAMSPGALYVDHTTVSPAIARRIAAAAAGRGVLALDAPVSGGQSGAENGQLAIMCGGDAAAFERAQPVLAALGKTIVLMGPSGSGQATKATNQILCAGAIQAAAEAMAFAQAEGLPLERVIDVLGKGAGSSWYFVHRAPFMARGEYPAGFRVRLHEKDLRICREMAARHGAKLPVVEATLADYARLTADGHAEEDISTVFRLKAPLFSGGGADG